MKRLNQLLKGLHSEDVDEMVNAAGAIDSEAIDSWLPRLRKLVLSGNDFFVREAAAWPVARFDGVRALPSLLKAQTMGTSEGHDNDGLTAAIIGVVELDPKGAIPLLKKLATSKSRTNREKAAWLLGFVNKHISPRMLLDLAVDRNSSVRSSALGSLASYNGNPKVYSVLVAGLRDPSEDVVLSAVSALGYFGNPKAKTAIAALRKRLSPQHQERLNYSLRLLNEAKSSARRATVRRG